MTVGVYLVDVRVLLRILSVLNKWFLYSGNYYQFRSLRCSVSSLDPQSSQSCHGEFSKVVVTGGDSFPQDPTLL